MPICRGKADDLITFLFLTKALLDTRHQLRFNSKVLKLEFKKEQAVCVFPFMSGILI